MSIIFEMGAKKAKAVSWDEIFPRKLEEDELEFQGSKNKPKKQNEKILSKNQHQLVFTFEKRKGKPVTLVGKFYIDESEKKSLLKLLKKRLACGGAIKDEWIELQGDVKQKVIDILSSEGWKFKK